MKPSNHRLLTMTNSIVSVADASFENDLNEGEDFVEAF